jgi:hypothetical protein
MHSKKSVLWNNLPPLVKHYQCDCDVEHAVQVWKVCAGPGVCASSPAHGKVGNNHFITLRGKFAVLKSQRLIEESNVTGCGLSNFVIEDTVSSSDSESESSVNRSSFGSVKCLDPATDRRVGLYG